MKRQIFLATLAASLVAAGCLLALPARATAAALTVTSQLF
ncbi:hypothetical protein F4827_006394 [Paraburkholderia bannensis]|uniref:Uncharacterized protein n=1 Tax=Paraburkholderia bannensis TaxID=765414 RepID=A0A7W9U3V1_9BURK|nr:hypothetical protein [Paraburkholderia bannensis]